MSTSYFVASLDDSLYEEGSSIAIKFSEGVISTGGTIKITQDGKAIEEITIGSDKISGGIYHTISHLSDYPYNWIALENYEIFKHLANHDNVEIDDKTEEDWAYDLRTVWNVAINGQLYRLDKDEYYSTDEYYNYHITTPEYTPAVEKSGMADIVISPLGGIKQLIIDPSNLDQRGSYIIYKGSSKTFSKMTSWRNSLRDSPRDF